MNIFIIAYILFYQEVMCWPDNFFIQQNITRLTSLNPLDDDTYQVQDYPSSLLFSRV